MPITTDSRSAASAWTFVRGNALSLTLLTAFLAGSFAVAMQGRSYHGAGGLIWSLGFSATGVLLGFLFAVPRPSRQVITPAPSPAPPSGQPPAPAEPGRHVAAAAGAAAVVAPPGTPGAEINTNLMEISDWLTKIIVGVGLVELKELPAHAESVARFMAPSLHASDGVPLAGAIMLYFGVLGFLSGYLLTRIYISQWFSWADAQTRSGGQMQLESGKVVDLDDLTRLQQPVIEDLQAQVAAQKLQVESLLPRLASGAPSAAASPAPAGSQLRILWADDKPHNNTLQINALEKEGHRVTTVLDTEQALAALQATGYDVLVTDMHRMERGQERPTAGIALLRAATGQRPGLPVLVFCGKTSLQRHGEEARAAGARLVTTSSTDLLAAVRALAQETRPPA